LAVERRVAVSAGAVVALYGDGQGMKVERISIIKDTQRHPVTGWLTHVDFYGVRYGEPIQVEVPVVLEGKAAGVAEGGLLQPVRRTLEIRCLPKDIPENIVIDVTPLGVGDAIHVNDLEVEGIEFIATTNFTIVTVQNVSGGAVAEEAEEGEELEEIEEAEE
jgi:large subunit ribosomal protein L25